MTLAAADGARWIGVLFLAAGAFSLTAALRGGGRFLSHPSARPFVVLLGRGGARLAYGVLGLLLLAVGAVAVAGGLD